MNTGLLTRSLSRLRKQNKTSCAMLIKINGDVIERFAADDLGRGSALANLVSIAASGERIVLSPGTFQVEAVIAVGTKTLTIDGAGRDASIIKRTTGAAGYVMTATNLRLRNLQVLADYAVDAGTTSVSVSGGVSVTGSGGVVTVDNCHIKASYIGLATGTGTTLTVRGCDFTCRHRAIQNTAGTVYCWDSSFDLSTAGNTGVGQDVNVPCAFAAIGATLYAWQCFAQINATDCELATSSGDTAQNGMFLAQGASTVYAYACHLRIVTAGPAALVVFDGSASTANLENCRVVGAVDASFGVYVISQSVTYTLNITGGSLVVTGTGSVAFRVGDNATLNVAPTAARFNPNSATLAGAGVLTFTNPSAMVIGRDLNTASPAVETVVAADSEIASNSGASGDNKLYHATAKNVLVPQT